MERVISTKNKLLITAVLCFCLVIGIGVYYISSTVNEPAIYAEDLDESFFKFAGGLIQEYSMEDLMNRSELVIIGRVIGTSEPFVIDPYGDMGASIFTDHYIELYEVLRGEAASERIAVRTRGGYIDRTVVSDAVLDAMHGVVLVVDSTEPDLEIGNKYLLFLNRPSGIAPFDTLGDYYIVTGLKQGAFLQEDSLLGRVDSNSILVNEITGYEVNLLKFHEEIVIVNELMPTFEVADYLEQQWIEELQSNVELGFMTEEEFYERISSPLFPGTIIR